MLSATIHREALTDHSKVYRVEFNDDDAQIVEFEAITEAGAERIAAEILSILGRYACLEVDAKTRFSY